MLALCEIAATDKYTGGAATDKYTGGIIINNVFKQKRQGKTFFYQNYFVIQKLLLQKQKNVVA